MDVVMHVVPRKKINAATTGAPE